MRILREFLPEYNAKRASLHRRLLALGGRKQSKGRFWWGGSELPDGRVEEYDEDFAFPILDLSSASPRSGVDSKFSYNFDDIDRVSTYLGIPWKQSKDIQFATAAPFTGIIWDLESRRIALTPQKMAKYSNSITAWLSKQTHIQSEVAKLHGQLIHACLVTTTGRAYITCLEFMLGIYGDSPFMPRTAPRATNADLEWWLNILSKPTLSRIIPGPCEVTSIPN
jgi:hypothetical protein